MNPIPGIDKWQYTGSVPTKPGTYHVRVKMVKIADPSQAITMEFNEPTLTARAETTRARRSGYVLAQEFNLWFLSDDLSRERRLTFFSPLIESSDQPAWSPDGKTIAFTYWPPTPDNEVPWTEIWSIAPDGSGLGPLVSRRNPGELLSYPAWSGDGKYLYFTVESVAAADQSALTNTLGTSFQPGLRVDRMEVGTGVRSEVLPRTQMAAPGDVGDEMVYLESAPPQDLLSASGQRIIHGRSRQH